MSNQMKKLIYILLIVLLISGCGSKEKKNIIGAISSNPGGGGGSDGDNQTFLPSPTPQLSCSIYDGQNGSLLDGATIKVTDITGTTTYANTTATGGRSTIQLNPGVYKATISLYRDPDFSTTLPTRWYGRTTTNIEIRNNQTAITSVSLPVYIIEIVEGQKVYYQSDGRYQYRIIFQGKIYNGTLYKLGLLRLYASNDGTTWTELKQEYKTATDWTGDSNGYLVGTQMYSTYISTSYSYLGMGLYDEGFNNIYSIKAKTNSLTLITQ